MSGDLFRDLEPLATLQTAKNTCEIVLYWANFQAV